MRLFLSRSIPPFTRVLLVESGSRRVFDRLIPLLEQAHGAAMELDLVTCLPDVPASFHGRIFRVTDYPTPSDRKRLFRELSARRYDVTGILCSAEPIMTKWKWALAARLPSKVFVINENADFFWLDWHHRRAIAHMARIRAGISGASAIPGVGRMVLFPFSLLYLLLFAGMVHLKRRVRML